jgi:hypothetical protein
MAKRDEISQCDHGPALFTFVDRALDSDRAIDRSFWRQATAELINSRPPNDGPDSYAMPRGASALGPAQE